MVSDIGVASCVEAGGGTAGFEVVVCSFGLIEGDCVVDPAADFDAFADGFGDEVPERASGARFTDAGRPPRHALDGH